MNKGELVASIADNAGLTQSQAEAALSATLTPTSRFRMRIISSSQHSLITRKTLT